MYEPIAALRKNRPRRFTPSGPTIGEIGDSAAGIRDAFIRRGAPADKPVCLCIEDRPLLLAALLASMAGAPPFIIPHAFHPQVLREVHGTRPFRLILADAAIEPPEGAEVIRVEECRPSDRP